jgi:cold shock CspA family protein
MAKSKETFNKKEKEKKRFKDKQDKRQKMEERKANKQSGKSLDQMMAYLDENGNLTDTPPDPRKKKVFELEEIQIGVPKHEPQDDVPRKGRVSFFNTAKGFGFIIDEVSGEKLFFHVKDLLSQIQESDRVEFMAERGPRGMNAVQVQKA